MSNIAIVPIVNVVPIATVHHTSSKFHLNKTKSVQDSLLHKFSINVLQT